jgi:hypothetical protein
MMTKITYSGYRFPPKVLRLSPISKSTGEIRARWAVWLKLRGAFQGFLSRRLTGRDFAQAIQSVQTTTPPRRTTTEPFTAPRVMAVSWSRRQAAKQKICSWIALCSSIPLAQWGWVPVRPVSRVASGGAALGGRLVSNIRRISTNCHERHFSARDKFCIDVIRVF